MDAESLSPIDEFQNVARRYDPEEELPLRQYGILISTYLSLFSGSYYLAHRLGKTRKRIAVQDILLLGVATHKFSRAVTKDKITGVIRAPFTEHGPSTGLAEVSDRAAGEGWRKAIGGLLTCPICLGVWTSTVMGFGLLFAPRLTRFVCAVLAAETISDSLQVGYGKLKKL